MSVPARVVHKRRATITALPLYYSGHLLKKCTKEKDFKKYYAELRGATLFLYTDETQDTYTEKLDLEQLRSMELHSPYKWKTPTTFTLALRTEEVQLKMDSPDTGEEWRGYILTVVKKEIPSKLQLLPGQMLLLQEALDQERRRNVPASCPPLPPRPSFLLSALSSPSSTPSPPPAAATDKPDSSIPDMPPCFFEVTRQEAERMLEENPEYGDIILRPSLLANNYALTLRQLKPSGPVMRHYRVTPTNPGFVIELDTAVTVSSLSDVIKYFHEKTEYRCRPYVLSQHYDTRIEVSPAPQCDGSISSSSSSSGGSITSPAPKPLPRAQVAPMFRSQAREEPPPPPTDPEECEYMVPDEDKPDDHNLKLVELGAELQQALKLRRENIYAAGDEEEAENDPAEKSHFCKAEWTTWSATV